MTRQISPSQSLSSTTSQNRVLELVAQPRSPEVAFRPTRVAFEEGWPPGMTLAWIDARAVSREFRGGGSG